LNFGHFKGIQDCLLNRMRSKLN